MKMTVTTEGITVTNTSKTAVGVVFPLVSLLLAGSALYDWIRAGVPFSESWFTLTEITALAVVGVWWLCTGFRQRALTYAYVFDRNGVREKRVIGKGKYIPWADMGEYICQYVGYKGKTYMPLYCVTFTSQHADKPVQITMPPFPETKLPVFRDQLFAFCDAARAEAERG